MSELWRVVAETVHGDDWYGAWRTGRAAAERQARAWRSEQEAVDRVWLERAETLITGTEEVPE